MKYSPLGRTGMLVSPLCLGNMMFGSWGNSDHDDCVRIVHRALDEGINFSELLDSDIEFLDGPVVFAVFGQVLHEFEASWVKCRSSARDGCRYKDSHKILFIR